MQSSPTARPRPFALIREFHLADWFTLANAVCGVGALFSVMSFLQTRGIFHIYFACALISAALVFDVLDGRIARWRQRSSAMGRELDSLSDVISFGVAPASLQRDRRITVRRCRQGQVLRGHADPDLAGAGADAGLRGLARGDRRTALVRLHEDRRLHLAPAGAGVRRVGLVDDQPDP